MSYQLIASVVFFVSAVLLLFVGTVVLRDNPRRKLNRVTGIMLILVGLGPLFSAIGGFFNVGGGSTPSESAVIGLSLAWELFFPQLILFSLVFPVERPHSFVRSRLGFLIFVPHIFHILLASLFYDPQRVTSLLTIDNPPETLRWLSDQFSLGAKFLVAILGSMIKVHLEFFAVVNLVYVAIALALLYQGYKTVSNQRLKTQTLIVIWGIRGAIGLYVIAFILPALGVIEISPTLKSIITILSLLVGAGSTVYAIVRYQFLDIRLIVRQSLVYTVTSAALVGVYILIINQLGKITKNLFGRDVAPVVDVAFVIVALILFQPAMSYVDNLIKRFFIRDRSDFRNIAEQFSRNLATIFDLDILKQNVGRVLRDQMLVEGVWFCFRGWGTDKFDLSNESEIPSESITVESTDPLIEQLMLHQKPVEVDEFGMEAVGRSACWGLLVERECRLIVPLHDSKKTLGFIALSRKASGYNYNYEDITTLSILGNQLVTAVSNARLYQESLEKQRLEE